MIKIFNKIFNNLKILMVLASFIMTLYILIFMYDKLGKDPFGDSFFEFFSVLLPFILVLILFVVYLVGKHTSVNDNSFFNASSIIAFLAILFFGYRALTDTNMIYLLRDGYHINFYYFADQITQIKVMLYIILFADILLIINGKLNRKKEVIIE